MRNAGKCPFTGEKCTKESRLLNIPFGVCSVWYGGTPRIICPNRFLFSGNFNKTVILKPKSMKLEESIVVNDIRIAPISATYTEEAPLWWLGEAKEVFERELLKTSKGSFMTR